MIPIFTIAMIVFIVVLKASITQKDREKEEAESAFWEREHQANFARKQDISSLDYITIPLDKFPPGLSGNSREALLALSDQKILNLTGISNTDLKLAYGVANLEKLSEYDDNFTRLVQLLAACGKELTDAGNDADARFVYEYAVSIRADSKQIYLALAKIYLAEGRPEKIEELKTSAADLKSISRDGILDALDALTTAG